MAISASDWKLEASTVTCDFEPGLMKACKTHFVVKHNHHQLQSFTE
jgi:hypothetical protein